MNWEQVDYTMQRASVPTGWLVRDYREEVNANGDDYAVLVCGYFVPDSNHYWKLEEKTQ